MNQAAADGATARATVVCAAVAANDEIEIAHETTAVTAEGSAPPTADDAIILEGGLLAIAAISHNAFEVNDGTHGAMIANRDDKPYATAVGE